MSKKCNNKCKCKKTICVAGHQGLRGIQGPQGVQGPIENILVSFDRAQTISANNYVNLGTIIDNIGTNIILNSPFEVVLQSGTYYIIYTALIANTSTAGDVGASIEVNGVIVPNASEYISSTTRQSQMVLQHCLTTSQQTIMRVANLSKVSNNYHDSSIFVVKLA